jgi:hypothetical protein
MTLGAILDRTISLYTHNFVLFFGIMLIPYGLYYVNQIIFTKSLTWSSRLATALYILAYIVIYLLSFAVGTGAATVAISSRYLEREISVAAAYKQALRRIGSILRAWVVAAILIVLVILGFLVGLFILIMTAEEIGDYPSPVMIPLITLLFILGTVLLIGRMVASYILITPVNVLENCSARHSRKRSRALTKGARWSILGIFFLYLIVTAAATYGSLAVVNLITGTDQSVFVTGKLTYIHHLVSAPLQFLFAPIPAILVVLIYYNQRIRKEGFDLILLVKALAED